MVVERDYQCTNTMFNFSFSFSAMGLPWDWHALPGHHWSPCKHNVLTTGVCTGTLAWPRGQNTSTAVDWDQTILSHLKSSEPSCSKCYKNYKNEINEWENNCQLLPSSFLKTKEPLTSSLHTPEIPYKVSSIKVCHVSVCDSNSQSQASIRRQLTNERPGLCHPGTRAPLGPWVGNLSNNQFQEIC